MTKRKLITTSVAIALSGMSGFSADALDRMENEEVYERHALAKSPEKLECAIALAEKTTGASALSVDFQNESDASVYQVELLAQDGSSLKAVVNLQQGIIEVIEA